MSRKENDFNYFLAECKKRFLPTVLLIVPVKYLDSKIIIE